MHEVLDIACILQSLDSSNVIETEQSSKPIIYLKTEKTSGIGFIRAIAHNARLQTEQPSKQSEIAHTARLKTEQPSKQISKRNRAILLVARDF